MLRKTIGILSCVVMVGLTTPASSLGHLAIPDIEAAGSLHLAKSKKSKSKKCKEAVADYQQAMKFPRGRKRNRALAFALPQLNKRCHSKSARQEAKAYCKKLAAAKGGKVKGGGYMVENPKTKFITICAAG